MPSFAAFPDNSTLPVLDRKGALERLGGDEALLDEFLGLLIEQADTELPQMIQAIVAGDAGQLEQLAHSLKGAAASLNAERVSEAARRLEVIGHDLDLGQAATALAQLEQEVQRIRELAGQ